MRLDPSASPWPGVLASVGVCLWIAAIGAPLAYTAFPNRPRLVWPFYAPIVGVVVVLLVTNLAAYVIPGAPSAWFGLIGSSAAAAVIAWRAGVPGRVSRQSALVLLTLALMAVGVFVLAFSNWMHVSNPDAIYHYALAQRLARGEFPQVTPYGVDAGIGYHYGHNLLMASIISVANVQPWAAFDALHPFLVVVLVLAVVGFAYDTGAPLPLALGIGATVGYFEGDVLFGYRTGYFEDLAFLQAPLAPAFAFPWLFLPQWSLAAGFIVLIAAALHAGVANRQAAVLAAAAGVLALAAALAASALLVVLAGGPISDELFGRGGTTGMARLAWEPEIEQWLPFRQAGPAVVAVGIIPLTMIGVIAAYRRRSWGLGFLAAAGGLGLLEGELLQPPLAAHDWRIFRLALAVAMIGAFAGVGALVGGLREGGRKFLATVAVGLLVLLPTSLPRATSGVHLMLKDLETSDPSAEDSGHHYRDHTTFGAELAANWEFYAWLERSLPTDARLLTPGAHLGASAAGVASPRSGRDLQVITPWIATWVYEDALHFLHRDDLADMGITHLHVTDRLAARLAPAARSLLDDPSHFKLLVDMDTSAGGRHRVFEVFARRRHDRGRAGQLPLLTPDSATERAHCYVGVRSLD